MSSRTEQFLFTWRIENFHLLPQGNGELITSPTFHVDRFFNTKWYLCLYPRGKGKKLEDYISCCLVRMNDDDGLEGISVDFELSVSSVSKITRHFFQKGDECEFRFFNELKWTQGKKLVESVVVKCHMTVYAIDPDEELILQLTSSATQKAIQCFWQSEHWPHPQQCFARSRVSEEMRSVLCLIMNIVCLERKDKLLVLVPSVSEIPTLQISFGKTLAKGAENINVEISFTDMLLHNVSLCYQVEIVHPLGESSKKSEGYLMFRGKQFHEILIVESLFTLSELEKHKGSNLQLKFSISDGTLFSNIDCIESVDYSGLENSFENSGNHNLSRYYIENKLLDVTFETTDRNFKAHKGFLASMSPVFREMFQSRMKESDTNVFINDLDSETVSQLLTFMYSGKFEELQYSKVMKLFHAADKYKIALLKKFCRAFLIKNLRVENICSMLLLADSHKDKEMKESAAYFISFHKNEIFLSQQWKRLADSHVKLGLEILQEICSKYS